MIKQFKQMCIIFVEPNPVSVVLLYQKELQKPVTETTSFTLHLSLLSHGNQL